MDTKIVLVAEWDGWCGACAVERPLVLTRSGRLGLRTWLTAPSRESRPLTLTCRLCGNSDPVPPEEDDPPVLLTPDEVPLRAERTAPPVTAGTAGGTTPTVPVALPAPEAPLAVPGLPPVAATAAAAAPAIPVRRDRELDHARGALGGALRALLAERTAQAGRVASTPSVVPPVPAVAAPALPLQRTAASDSDGLATLQLLADGLDLLSSSRT